MFRQVKHCNEKLSHFEFNYAQLSEFDSLLFESSYTNIHSTIKIRLEDHFGNSGAHFLQHTATCIRVTFGVFENGAHRKQ